MNQIFLELLAGISLYTTSQYDQDFLRTWCMGSAPVKKEKKVEEEEEEEEERERG